ncbi:MAG: restriction endonuclease subunit S, partial [Paracoccus sp. BP8]
MEAVGEYGGLALDQEKPLDEIGSGYTYFRDDDVVVAKITPCFENGKGALAKGLKNGIAFGTTELHVLRARENMDPGFLFYLTISDAFRDMGEAHMYGAGGQKRVPELFIRDLRSPVPPAEEQRKIALFLDRKTGEIDKLIRKREELLAVQREKRMAMVTHAVTQGFATSTDFTQTSIPWLQKIPAHWRLVPLKWCCH